MPNSTKSQVFKIPLYLLNGRHYLVKLKAWRELWEAAGGLKDPPLSDATISIENSHKKKKEKKNRQNSLQCSYSQKKKKKIPIIRYPFKKFHLDISRDLFSLYLNYICSENYHQNITVIFSIDSESYSRSQELETDSILYSSKSLSTPRVEGADFETASLPGQRSKSRSRSARGVARP